MYDQEAWEDGYRDAIANEQRKTRTIYAMWDDIDIAAYWYDCGYDAGMESTEQHAVDKCAMKGTM